MQHFCLNYSSFFDSKKNALSCRKHSVSFYYQTRQQASSLFYTFTFHFKIFASCLKTLHSCTNNSFFTKILKFYFDTFLLELNEHSTYWVHVWYLGFTYFLHKYYAHFYSSFSTSLHFANIAKVDFVSSSTKHLYLWIFFCHGTFQLSLITSKNDLRFYL